ncbi:MAG: hypothetical protein ACRCVJ_00030 [Clostridium sp.]|uniref:hypothetical protein n=1 Tax=Clostridium sp. TaxID=1506 RepID=UPI003F38F11E
MKKKVFSIPVNKFTIDTNQDDLTPVRIQVCHDRENPNGSYFEMDSLIKAKDSIKNKPIIAAYEINENNEKEDFKGHEVEYKIINENGKIEFKEIYIEQPIGGVPESCDYTIEEIDGYNWVCVNGYLYNNYCEDAIEILKNNDGSKKISMEIEVLDGYEDEKDGFFHITDFKFLGITCLGKDYNPAMGSNAEISLFTKAEQTEQFALKFTEILNKINNKGGEKVGNGKKKAEFSLSVNDLEKGIREKLSDYTYTYTYSWGETEEYRRYYLRDVLSEEKIVIVEDNQDNYKTFGIPYEINGDEISLKIEEGIRYIRGDWRVFEEKEDDNREDSKDHIDLFNKIQEKETKHYRAEIEEVKNSFVATETEEYKTLKSDFDKVEADKKNLEEFKAEFEKKERVRQETELFEKFKDLESVEGFAEIKDRAGEFSLDELEKEFYVLIGKKNFSTKKTEKKDEDTISLKVEGNSSVNNELSEAEKRYGIGIK